MAKSTGDTAAPESIEGEAVVVNEEMEASASSSMIPEVSNRNMAIVTGFGLALVVIIVMLLSDNNPSEVAALSPETPSTLDEPLIPASAGDSAIEGDIERNGEGRHFYTTIKIPPGAETLYLSGSGASALPDGTWGSMEQQTLDTFNSFKDKLESEGWSMSDIVQVRAFAVADEYGLLDFDGFNRGYREFFGTEENPMKPVRSFVQVADLVVGGWLVEIEVRAARMP